VKFATWCPYGSGIRAIPASMCIACMIVGLMKESTPLMFLSGSRRPGSTQYTPLQEAFG
jgi:hypothetical protein